jgi:hypothetical protein
MPIYPRGSAASTLCMVWLALVASCALPPKIELFPISTTTKPTVLKNYDIGVTRTTTVGDPIFRLEQAVETHSYVAQKDFRHRTLRVAMGARYVATDSTARGSLRLMNCGGYGGPADLLVGRDFKTLWVLADDGQMVEVKTGDEPLFQPSTGRGRQPGAFTAEMIYSGLAGKVMRAVYREYVEDLARPAFSQELQYDLGADRTIAYKSLRMRVEDASNSAIRYAIVSDGDLPWLPEPKATSSCS